jgi:hypothetical protein
MKPTLLLPIALLLFTSGCLFLGPEEFVPEPDDCSSPRALDGIDTIEIGHTESNEFVPWQDGQLVELTYGPQGGAMLGVVLSVNGRNLPACMEHSMTLTSPMVDPLAVTSHPVQTYDGAGDTRVTRPIWMIFAGPEPLPGDPLDLVLQVGELEVHRSLVVR